MRIFGKDVVMVLRFREKKLIVWLSVISAVLAVATGVILIVTGLPGDPVTGEFVPPAFGSSAVDGVPLVAS